MLPLCVDMDGTLLKGDTLFYLLGQLRQQHFFKWFFLLFALSFGRAFFKRRLSVLTEHIDLSPMPVNPDFYAYLEIQHQIGRRLLLVTAADQSVGERIAALYPLFSTVIGSDGKTNLRRSAKGDCLVARFGEKGFVYAGNSHHDIPVWEHSKEVIIVNAKPRLVRRVLKKFQDVTTFDRGYVDQPLP